MQLKLSAFVSAACVQSWWLFSEVHSFAMCWRTFFFPFTLTRVRVSMQIKRSRLNAGETKRKRSNKKNTHSEKWHSPPPKMCIFSDKCYLVERQSWFYSVIQCIFFCFFFKRSEKVFFWALRTKTPAGKVLACMLARRTGTLHHSANAAPSFLISSNLWFKGLQAILATTHQRISWGGGVN